MGDLDGAQLVGIATIGATLISALTWWLTTKEHKSDSGRGLIEDALTIQRSTHRAYEEAQEELEALRTEVQYIRDEVAIIKQEVTHWRSVADAAREEYRQEKGLEPAWWKPFIAAPQSN